MRKLLYIFFLVSSFGFSQYGNNGPVKAFPSAWGGGSTSTGGRGGVLIIVNTLDANTPLTGPLTNAQGETYYTGGLRAAWGFLGARYIVFNVSGNIPISADMGATRRNNMTVFGHSAPQGGITVTGDNIQLTDSDHITMRYFRSRNGKAVGNPITDDQSTYAFKVNGGDHIIFDHVSASWGGDKAILMGTNLEYSQNNHTIQRSLLSDSHTYVQMSNQNAANFPNHQNVSFIGNLLGRGENRTPNIGGTNGYIEVINNVIQTTGTKFGVIQWSDNAYVNWDRNYYKLPTATTETNEFQRQCCNKYTTLSFYDLRLHTEGNIYQNTNGFRLDGTETGRTSNAIIWTYRLGGIADNTPIDQTLLVADAHSGQIPNPAPFRTAQEAYDWVIADVGANLYMDESGVLQTYQDSWDTDIIANVEINQMDQNGYSDNWILPSIPNNTHGGSYDTDNDGMADAWEIAQFGDLTQGYGGDFDGDGYENIEEFFFTQEDLDASGVTPTNSCPVVVSTAGNSLSLSTGDTYTEAGGTWTDTEDGSGAATVGGDTVNTAVAGTYVVTYSYTDAGGCTDVATLTVVVSDPATIAVTGVTIAPADTSLDVGQTVDLTETYAPANATDKTGTWSTLNPEIASISSSGLVTVLQETNDRVINGGFDTDTDWIKQDPAWTISGGTANCDGTQPGNRNIYQNLSFPYDRAWEVQFTVSNYVAGQVRVYIGGYEPGDWVSANGTYNQIIRNENPADGILWIYADADFIGSIDNISVKEVVQATYTTNDGGFTDTAIIRINEGASPTPTTNNVLKKFNRRKLTKIIKN